MNRLYFGDNLHVLRERIADASVELFYPGPSFGLPICSTAASTPAPSTSLTAAAP